MRTLNFIQSTAFFTEFGYQTEEQFLDFVINKIQSGKLSIDLDITNDTKTRLSLTAQIGRTREKINFENPNYKQDLVESQSIFSDNINKSYYFKVNKKQDLNVFKQYVIEQLNTYITILENAITKRGIESNALQNIDIIISYNESNVNVEDFKRIFEIKEIA